MPLKFQVDSIDEVEEGLRTHYTEKDGKFFLQVDGAVSKAKLDEFRNNNIELMKRLEPFKDIQDIEDFKARQSVDMDEYQRLKADALKGAKLTQADVDNMVNDRVKTMKAQFDAELNSTKETLSIANRQLESLLIDSGIQAAAIEGGIKSTAIPDAILRAKQVFKVKDGAAIPYDKNNNVLYGADGETPMSIQEWVKNLRGSAPHLFDPSVGSGTRPKGHAGTGASNLSSLQKIRAGLS